MEFNNFEEEILANKWERKVDSKLKKSLERCWGDCCKTDIDIGDVPENVRNYLLREFSKCSLDARYLGEGIMRVSYNIH
ncbi:MAG: hypothetical protein ABIA78_04260 [archaeon]